jgi:Cu/Ag efflux protein CusF
MGRSVRYTRFPLLVIVVCAGIMPVTVARSKKPPGKWYELHGRVVAVDSGSRLLTVAHEDIPGLMSGMTMPFQVARQDDWIFGKIRPGDQLMATLRITDHAELENVSFTKASDASGDGTSHLRVPEVAMRCPTSASSTRRERLYTFATSQASRCC